MGASKRQRFEPLAGAGLWRRPVSTDLFPRPSVPSGMMFCPREFQGTGAAKSSFGGVWPVTRGSGISVLGESGWRQGFSVLLWEHCWRPTAHCKQFSKAGRKMTRTGHLPAMPIYGVGTLLGVILGHFPVGLSRRTVPTDLIPRPFVPSGLIFCPRNSRGEGSADSMFFSGCFWCLVGQLQEICSFLG